MGKKCSLKNCNCNYDNSVGVTFHRFPLKDIRYEQWLKAIPESLIELPLHQHTYICSRHFPNNSYQPVTPTLMNILKRNAVPSIFYIKSNKDVTSEDDADDFLLDTEQTSLLEEEIQKMPKRTFADVSTQVSPKRIGVSEREEKLQRDVINLQRRLHRRDEAMKRMHNVLETLLENRQKFKYQCDDNSTSEGYG